MTLILVLTLVSGTVFLISDNVIGAAKLTLTAAFIENAPVGLDDSGNEDSYDTETTVTLKFGR